MSEHAYTVDDLADDPPPTVWAYSEQDVLRGTRLYVVAALVGGDPEVPGLTIRITLGGAIHENELLEHPERLQEMQDATLWKFLVRLAEAGQA